MSTRTFTFLVTATSVLGWVPSANTARIYTVGQLHGFTSAPLQNTLASTCVPYYQPYFQAEMTYQSYSTCIPNPYMGAYGGLVFRGGGHSATNNNGVYALVAETAGFKWYRLSSPTPWFGTGTDATTLQNNDGTNGVVNLTSPLKIDTTWGDALPAVDSRRIPVAAHTYSYGDVIPPSKGGGAHGTFYTACSAAGARQNEGTSGAGHYLTIGNYSGGDGSNTWARAGTQSFSLGFYPPFWSVYVEAQHRSYFFKKDTSADLQWMNHATGLIGTNSGAFPAFKNADAGANNSGRAMYLPNTPTNSNRELVLAVTRKNSRVCINWMDVSVSTPTQNLTDAVLSQPIYLSTDSTAACWFFAEWCPDIDRIVIGQHRVSAGGAFDHGALMEIQVPDNLRSNPTATWTVTRRTFSNPDNLQWADESVQYQRWCYLPAIKSFVRFPRGYNDSVSDKVYLIRPFGT